MTQHEITLRPDRNRLKLESILAGKLADGIIPDSLQNLDYNPWQKGETPRVLLIVPHYTRIKRPLDLVLSNLEKDENDAEQLNKDREIISTLKSAGINYLEEMKRAGVPMGLLRVGTAAKKAGYDVKILDAVYEGWNNEQQCFTTSEGSQMISYGLPKSEIAKRIKGLNPHIVGITVDYTHQWGNAREIADLVKQLNEKTIIVMGGAHANGLPEDVLYDSPTDFVVLRQADRTFPELLDVLTRKSQKSIEDVKGIALRKKGSAEYTQRRAFMPDIGEIAIPDLSLVNLGLYSGRFHSAGERQLGYGKLLYVFTSIGCNTKCTFCAIPPAQGPWVSMREKSLDELLNCATKSGVTEVLIEDDHLFHDPEWALTAFKKLEEYKLPWVEEGGVGLFNLIALLPEADETFIKSSIENPAVFNKTIAAKRKGITTQDLIRRMKESGCYSIYLAVESANDYSLYTSHKPTLNTQEAYTQKVVELFHEYGIRTTCGLMLGFINPNGSLYVEPRKNIEKTIEYGKFLERAGATYINPFIFTPLPGAPHFTELKKYITPNTDECFSHEFGTIDAPNREWTRDELNLLRVWSIVQTNGLDGYKRILKTGTWPVSK